MYILGLNAFHGDSSACILKDGKMLIAIEEERIRRIKHWAGFPIEAIKYCLKDSGISITEIDHITISRDPSANVLKKIKHTIKNKVSFSAILDRYTNSKKVKSVKAMLSEELGIKESDIKAEIHNIEHHRSHLASAFFASPFEESAIVSIDGFGDFTSTMIATGKGNKIEVLDAVHFPHSVGIFYTSFTQYLGFPKYGDEYKVMGLAPYGKPLYVDKLKDVISLTDDGLFKLNLDYFKHHKNGVKMSWEGGEPDIESIFSEYMVEKFGPARKKEDELTQYHKDLAASVQRMCEEIIFHILTHLQKRTGLKKLCVAGGVAQNSVANGKILQNTDFEELYIPSAGHDAGTSMGSALYLYNHVLKQKRAEPMFTASLGSHYSNEEIETFLKSRNVSFVRYSDEELYDKVTDCIINAGVVGWFQGRAEFGPRALGHRSIIADPRRNDAKEILNLKIKRRESFRPFAPSILIEAVPEYFAKADGVPFMEKVYLIKEEMRSKIPAVTHVDGTGRLQSVDAKNEPRYYALISAFHKKTGVPILLNTSFNENEPIVNSPENALDCFLRTKMDMLVLENFIVSR
ncbi:MAG TPA: carbamoyltransferase C-terminal domain-containing protein [Bacteroidia bacterium]|jgi:carbamoyltransferase